MKITHLNTYDIKGGAARATYRIHLGLIKNEVNSKILVQNKKSNDSTIKEINPNIFNTSLFYTHRINKIPLKIFKKKELGVWSINCFPTNINKYINQENPDIVNLHWLGKGFLSLKDIGKIKKPIVWTLHDMWPFTGGFHYSQKYLNHDTSFISKLILKSKKKYWKKLNLTIVAPSHWLADQARKSELFKNKKIKVIPNGLNEETFKPINKNKAKQELGLSLDKKYILFGAINATNNPIKGFSYLQEALKIFSEQCNTKDIEVLVFGANNSNINIDKNIKINYLGNINNDNYLGKIYSSADVMIVPSIQEAFGQTASESMSCGTPVVCFNVTGLKDIVDHKHNGYLATPYNPEELAKGINWVLEDEERRKKLSKNARQKVLDNFTLDKIASQYINLYKEILHEKKQ